MDVPLSSHRLVRLLAAPARRRLVAALVLADDPLDHRALAEATGLGLREVADAADRLATAGLFTAVGDGYQLIEEVFEQAARAEVEPPPASEHADQPSTVARILDAVVRDGKLVRWPAKRSKRLVVLDYLAQQFEIGHRYSESEVNDRLRSFDDDVATTRRYLVDERFLDRDDGHYWRCGGTV